MSQNGGRHFPILYNVISNEFKSIPISVPKVPGGLFLMLNDGRIMEFGGYEFSDNFLSSPDKNNLNLGLQTFYNKNMVVNAIETYVKSATIYDFEKKPMDEY